MRRPAAITGLGAVSGYGFGATAFWEGLTSGRSSIAPITSFDVSGFPVRHGAEATGFSVKEHVPKHYRKATKVMARDTELAVGAAADAARDAKIATKATLDESTSSDGAAGADGAAGFAVPAGRMGCQIGAGLIAADTAEIARAMDTSRLADDPTRFDPKAWGTVGDDDGAKGAMNNLPPLWLLKYLPNMLACHVTILHGCEGPSNTITCAEASALLSIGEGCRVIERGAADLCFSGGAESKLNYMGILRMLLAGRLARTDDLAEGTDAIKPFQADSRGSVVGEGGGILIIEDDEHAKARGARRYATIEGFGASHAPPPFFPGAIDTDSPDVNEAAESMADAITAALDDAGIDADAVDAVVPLGSGTPWVDAAERAALTRVFGDRNLTIAPISKAVGNTMAGHGGLQTAAAALALFHGVTPAWIGTVAGSEPRKATETAPEVIVVCAPAVGGQNAALVLKRADRAGA